jgi:redox-sensitive bicupin YhaK (pirin superfamily)
VTLHQDALVYAGLFDGRENASYDVKNARAYVHVARGRITVNGHALNAGDALKTEEGVLELEDGEKAEVLVFDLP